jgi:hypothetical protein
MKVVKHSLQKIVSLCNKSLGKSEKEIIYAIVVQPSHWN